MKPEIAKMWNMALSKLKKAEQHLREGEGELAICEAKNAWAAALPAITILWEGDKWAKDRVIERIFKGADPFSRCSDPTDYVVRAAHLLKSCADLSPQGDSLPYP